MTPNSESDQTRSTTGTRWSVHFLFGQKAWGERASQWGWIGKGEISLDRHFLNIDGRRHRYFRTAAKQEVRIGLHQVRNVVAAGRLVRFEVKLESLGGERVEVIRLRTDTAQAAQEIASSLPATRSEAFERAHNEKLSYDRSLEELGTRPIVTAALVSINIAWYLFVASQGGGWLVSNAGVIIHWGSNFGPLTLSGEWWRLFTCMFVHFGIFHIVLNMWVLWSLGRVTERTFGSLHYALLYVFAGLCGSVASLWWHPNVNSAGASGAIFGILGGLLAFVLNPASRVPPTIVASQRRSIVLFVAYSLVGGVTAQGIDNAAHLGGLVGGFMMGWILARPLDATAREQAQPRFAVAGVVGMAVLAAISWHLSNQPHVSPVVAFQQSARRNRIELYPGMYQRVVFKSGEKVTAAMKVVHEAMHTPDLDAAIDGVRRMADAGDAEAAFRLGRYYDRESGEPDYASALKYYQMASEKNHGWATNNLAMLYEGGKGAPKNTGKAHAYFEKAASLHDQWAYVTLAEEIFRSGEKDAAKNGIEYLDEAGHNQCTMCLVEEAAIYHVGGYGVARDSDKTLWLLNKAAALGDVQATLIIAEMHIVGDGVEQNSKTAVEMLKTLSDNGDAYASTLLGELSSDDKIRNYLFDTKLGGASHIPKDLTAAIPQDTSKAIQYWERANAQGSCQSWIDLSSTYDRGISVPQDYRRGADDVERAVHCDPANGFFLYKLSERFYGDRGRDRDCLAAERFLRESLDHGYDDAAVNLGYIYDKGCEPIARDDYRALQIYLLGAKLGVALCENNVGAMVKHGRGIGTADPARGYGWIRLAAMHGNDLAKANLKDPLFTPSVQAAGLLQLADIQIRLRSVPSTAQAILKDPWY
jgi:membrane associated rhomboid family serine protease/TPR repeat protein